MNKPLNRVIEATCRSIEVNIYTVKMIAPEVPVESIFEGAPPFVGAMILTLFLIEYELTRGEGRARANVAVNGMGSDLVVRIYNQNAHIGAVAVGDYGYEHQRASVSVITRLGHKEDALAGEVAYLLSKSIRRPVCVIAGVHLDNITREEIDKILTNTKIAISEIINVWTQQKRVN